VLRDRRSGEKAEEGYWHGWASSVTTLVLNPRY
jgi:hypothetical protein